MVGTIVKRSIAKGEHPIAHFFHGRRKKLYYGPMGAGKTTKIQADIDYISAFLEQNPPIEKIELIVFKPAKDTRSFSGEDPSTNISSRLTATPAFAVRNPLEILDKLRYGSYYVLVYDEANFGPSSILELIDTVDMHNNLYLIAAGLNLDFRGRYFPLSDFKATMLDVIRKFDAEEQQQLYAICNKCGKYGATHTQRISIENGVIKPALYYDVLHKVGGNESYHSRHFWEFEIPGRAEWEILELLFERKASKKSVSLDEVLEISEIPKQVFMQIINRFQEERIIEVSNGRAMYIKEY